MTPQPQLPCSLWQIGDIVSRDGTDEHEILEIFNSENFHLCETDNIRVQCVKEPVVPDGDDGPWTKIGEDEINLARRYTFIRPRSSATIRG